MLIKLKLIEYPHVTRQFMKVIEGNNTYVFTIPVQYRTLIHH